MKLLVVRHGIAQPHDTPDVADEERRLTARGKRRFRKAARGLARIVPRPDLVLTSPLARAVETAEIAARAWGRVKPKPEPLLASGETAALLSIVGVHDKTAVIALFGHEPHVSALVGHLVGGSGERLPFRRGGAALLEVDGVGAGSGRLIWFLPPRLLRRLGRS